MKVCSWSVYHRRLLSEHGSPMQHGQQSARGNCQGESCETGTVSPQASMYTSPAPTPPIDCWSGIGVYPPAVVYCPCVLGPAGPAFKRTRETKEGGAVSGTEEQISVKCRDRREGMGDEGQSWCDAACSMDGGERVRDPVHIKKVDTRVKVPRLKASRAVQLPHLTPMDLVSAPALAHPLPTPPSAS